MWCLHLTSEEAETSEECKAGLNPDLTSSKDHALFLSFKKYFLAAAMDNAKMTLILGSVQYKKEGSVQTWAGQVLGE